MSACSRAEASLPVELLLLLALALAAGCEPPREAVSPPLPPGNPARQPLEAPQRPDVVRSFPIDYGALPFMLTVGFEKSDRSASIAFLSDPAQANPRTAIVEGMVAEVEVEGLRIFTPLSGASVPEVQRLPNATAALCPEGNLLGSTPTGPAAARSATPGRQRSITWEGIRTKTWSRDHLDYVRFEGSLDGAACKATATRVAAVRAQAIIPGLLYGFRTCVPVCDAPPSDAGREEMLVLIGPRAVWAGSSVPWPSLQTNPHIGSFSRIVVPLRRGGSASALLNVEEHELNRFIDARPSSLGRQPIEVRKNLPVTQLAVDVSWLASDDAPLGIGFVSSVADQRAGKGGASFDYETAYSFDE